MIFCRLIPDIHRKVDIFARPTINLSVRARAITFERWVDFVPTHDARWLEIERVQFLDLSLHCQYTCFVVFCCSLTWLAKFKQKTRPSKPGMLGKTRAPHGSASGLDAFVPVFKNFVSTVWLVLDLKRPAGWRGAYPWLSRIFSINRRQVNLFLYVMLFR